MLYGQWFELTPVFGRFIQMSPGPPLVVPLLGVRTNQVGDGTPGPLQATKSQGQIPQPDLQHVGNRRQTQTGDSLRHDCIPCEVDVFRIDDVL